MKISLIFFVLFHTILAVSQASDEVVTDAEQTENTPSRRQPRLTSYAKTAQPNEFPYQVSLRVNGGHVCGASLIGSKYVLTAAHCVYPLINRPYPSRPVEVVDVKVGSNSLNSGGEIYPVHRLAYHRDFDPALNKEILLPNDIAVVTLVRDVTESASVKPIKLPPVTLGIPADAGVVVTGWGNAAVNGDLSPNLQKMVFYVISREECRSIYQQLLRKTIVENQLCARLAPGYGTCQGDSGGPLVYDGYIIGIVSGGNGECADGNPDIYTDVRKYLPFIDYELNNPRNDGPQSPSISLEYSQIGQPQYPQPPPPPPPGPFYVPYPIHGIIVPPPGSPRVTWPIRHPGIFRPFGPLRPPGRFGPPGPPGPPPGPLVHPPILVRG